MFGAADHHDRLAQDLYDEKIAIARSVLIEDGYDAFVLRGIADRVGIKLGNLQYYFSTREDLLETIAHAENQRAIDLVAAGVLKPVIDGRFAMNEINEVMDRFARSGKQGRILISFDSSDSAFRGETLIGGRG